MSEVAEEDQLAFVAQSVCRLTVRGNVRTSYYGTYASGFLCSLRSRSGQWCHGLMTSSKLLSEKMLFPKAGTFIDVDFQSTPEQKDPFQIQIGLDTNSYFTEDKVLKVTFIEFMPETLRLLSDQKRLNFLPISSSHHPEKGRPIFVFQYPYHESIEGTPYFAMDEIMEFMSNGILKLRSPTQPRTTGSPVVSMSEDGSCSVVALHKGFTDQGYSLAVSIETILSAMRKESSSSLWHAPDSAFIVASRSRRGSQLSQHSSQVKRTEPVSGPPNIISQNDSSNGDVDYQVTVTISEDHEKNSKILDIMKNHKISVDDLARLTDSKIAEIFPQFALRRAVLQWLKANTKGTTNARDPTSPTTAKGSNDPKEVKQDGKEATEPNKAKKKAISNPKPDLYFSNWVKTPAPLHKGLPSWCSAILTIVDPKAKQVKNGGVASSLMIICSKGEVLVFSATDWKKFIFKTKVFWKNGGGQINHAAYDEVTDDIYFSLNGGPIYWANRATLLTRSNDNTSLQHQLQPLIARDKADGRDFSGLAVDSQNRLLFACSDEGKRKDVSIWKLLLLAGSDARRGAELVTSITETVDKNRFSPGYCSLFVASKQKLGSELFSLLQAKVASPTNNKKSSDNLLLLAVSQYDACRIDLFGVERDSFLVNPKQTPFKHIDQVAAKGSDLGAVKWPLEVLFDLSGNLFVVENGNNRFQAFALNGGNKLMTACWASDGELEGAVHLSIARQPKTNQLAALVSYIKDIFVVSQSG